MALKQSEHPCGGCAQALQVGGGYSGGTVHCVVRVTPDTLAADPPPDLLAELGLRKGERSLT